MKIKIVSTLFFLIFVSFAYLQFNDPDPVFWISIYTSVALVSLLRTFGIYRSVIFLVFSIVLVAISLTYVSGFIEYMLQPNKNEIIGEMVYKKPYIEETREFLGLWIAAASTFYQYKLKG